VPFHNNSSASDKDDVPEKAEEDAEAQLGEWKATAQTKNLLSTSAWMSKKWESHAYAFYHPAEIGTGKDGHHMHIFRCAAWGCKHKVQCYIEKTSTSNMIKHAKSCWGDDAWCAAQECNSNDEMLANVVKPLNSNGSIKAIFQQKGKANITFLHRQHTRAETKFIIFYILQLITPLTLGYLGQR